MRLFVGLELHPDLRAEIAALQVRLRASAGEGSLRWTDVSAMHLTLVFLGEVERERVKGLGTAISGAMAAARTAPCLSMGPVGRFPGVLWVGIEALDGGLIALQRSVEAALVPLGWRAAVRPFQPHVTLARGRGAAGLVLPEGGPHAAAGPAMGVALFQSHLTPGGSRYEVLRRWPFSGSPEEG